MVFVKAQMFKHYDAVARALSQSLSDRGSTGGLL